MLKCMKQFKIKKISNYRFWIENKMRAKNTQCSTRSNSRIETKKMEASDRTANKVLEIGRLRAREILRIKYSKCENGTIFSKIQKAIISGNTISTYKDKQCPLRATIKDIQLDFPHQKLQLYCPIRKSVSYLRQLIDYYRFYEQKTIIFLKDFFLLVFQHHQRRKVVQYNRLKVLLNLTDSNDDQKKCSYEGNKLKIMPCDLLANDMPIDQKFKNYQQNQQNNRPGYRGVKILDDIDLRQFSFNFQTENEESILIKSLRNKLSNHIGKTTVKNLSIQQLDRCFNFQKIDQNFQLKKYQLDLYFTQNPKNKNLPNKAKFTLPQSFPEQPEKDLKIRRKINKRKSCELITKKSLQNGPIDLCMNKIRHKKNLSIDWKNFSNPTSNNTERNFFNFKFRKNKQQQANQKQEITKKRITSIPLKDHKNFIDSINDLKSKIQKDKQKLKVKNLTNKQTVKKQKNQQNIVFNTRKNGTESIKKVNRKIPRKIHNQSKSKTLNCHVNQFHIRNENFKIFET